MTYKFTNSSSKVIEMANNIAKEMGHNYVGWIGKRRKWGSQQSAT